MVDRRALAALGLAVLLTTAGCSALPVGGNDNPLGDDGTTDGPASEADAKYPPGVTDNGIENASDLLSVHHNRLGAEGSFTLDFSQTVTQDGEVVSNRSRDVKMNNQTAMAIVMQDGETTERTWSNGSQTVQELSVKLEDGSTETRASVRPGAFGVRRYMSERSVSTVITAMEYENEGTETLRGKTVFKLNSTGISDKNILEDAYSAAAIRNADATVWVTPKGQILKMDVSVDMLDQDGQRTTVDNTYEIKNVGQTSVNEPNWVTEARSDATKLNGELSENQRYLKITHEGGQPIEDGLLQVYVSGNQLRETTDLTISEGDTVYAYVTEEGQFMLTATPPGENTTAQKLPGLRVEFYTQERLPAGAAQDRAEDSSSDN